MKIKFLTLSVIAISLFCSCEYDDFNTSISASSSSSVTVASSEGYSASKTLNGVTVRDSILFRTGDSIFSLMIEATSPVVDTVRLFNIRDDIHEVVELPYKSIIVYPDFVVRDTLEYLISWNDGNGESHILFLFTLEGDGKTISWKHRYW